MSKVIDNEATFLKLLSYALRFEDHKLLDEIEEETSEWLEDERTKRNRAALITAISDRIG